MAAYVDYAFYTGTYKGAAIAQADFDRLALRASEAIDQMTHDRAAPVVEAATDTAMIDKIKMAACAVAEKIQELEANGGILTSESVGRGFSASYASKLTSDTAVLTKIAKRYIGRTFLMYPGFNKGELADYEKRDDLYPWGWP
jgi:hypothetical protein